MRAITLWFLVLCAPACGPSEADVCDLKCDCEGCSDRQYDDCLDHLDDDLRRAEDRDCLDQWDDLLACQDDTGRCKGDDKFEDDCGHERDRFKNCVD
jgi:hypothetical protein